MNEKLFNIVGISDDLCGFVFARCSAYDKAQKAKEIFEAKGYAVEIVQDELMIDVIEIGEEMFYL